MKYITISILLLGILLTGCASTSVYSEWNKTTGEWEDKWKITNRGNIKAEVTKEKVSTDSKTEPLFKVDFPLNKNGG